MARPANKVSHLSFGLEEYQDDDFVLRNGEALQELVKEDLELLSMDCLDTTECLLRLVTYYRAEIMKLHGRLSDVANSPILAKNPMLVPRPRAGRAFLSPQAR